MPNSDIIITPEQLQKSAIQYRRELLLMISIGLTSSLQHMSLRPGIQYKQMVGETSGNAEFGPYDPNRKSLPPKIKGRELEVFLGSVVEDFDPNTVVQSIYGSLILSGEGLKGVPITKAILAAEMKSLSEKLNMALFSAVRNPAGTKSVDLFNGFDTITQNEITAATITAANKNLFDFTEAITSNNAVELLKTYYRASVDELKGERTKMFMPISVLEAYEDDYQQTVGAAPYNTKFEKRFLEGSNSLCELVPMVNKKDSKFIHLTTKKNMLVGTGNANDLEKLSVDRFSAFMVTLSAAILFGVNFESINPKVLNVGKLFVAP